MKASQALFLVNEVMAAEEVVTEHNLLPANTTGVTIFDFIHYANSIKKHIEYTNTVEDLLEHEILLDAEEGWWRELPLKQVLLAKVSELTFAGNLYRVNPFECNKTEEEMVLF
ncbi:hypothetical protein [Vibrio crassostreae]|uniref:hypothetical protein n=1 Tax=Vibrio crassostreae TaxID=246167 RepID=UPI001B307FC9|nr:hypothetical protein [Vibrio crassostreae]